MAQILNMKFKNFDGIEYTVNYNKPLARLKASGLCDSPDAESPQIHVDPNLLTRRQLNVLIEEVFHAHLFDLPEWKARKFSANLGKLIYNRFLSK
jgi:hypothetical protein